jgi:Protein of unknown function (DUF3592)
MGATPNPRTPSRALGFVFLPFFVLGLFFVVMVVREAIASAATYAWQPARCLILASEVRESSENSPWFAYLRYTSPTGESVRSSRLFRNYRDAVLFTRRWPAGSGATCYPDPHDPAGALLGRKNTGLVLLLFLPIPLPFVFIGAGGFYSVVFRWQPQSRVRYPGNPVAGRRFVAGLMTVAGLALSIAFLLGPVRHAIAARSWSGIECKILRSRVRQYHTRKGSDTYSPEILYSYGLADNEHRSDVYSFFEYSASGWASSRRIASRYRYVNPSDPDDATLNRNPSLGWLIGILPLALLAGGLAVWPRCGRARRQAPR